MPEQASTPEPLPILGELRSELQRVFLASERTVRPAAFVPDHRPRMVAGSALAIACLAILTALLLSAKGARNGDLAYALPVLREPATDARAIRTKAQELTQAGANFRDAHAITTPYGTGYVMPATEGRKLCLAIPDRVDGYGVGCTPSAKARREGLYGWLVGSHGSEFVAVLAVNGQATMHRGDGSASVLSRHGDVATVVIHRKVRITIRAGAFSETITVPGSLRCSSTPTKPGLAGHGHFRRDVCSER